MIIVYLNGGLGNQMFQYATGRAIAAKYQVSLLLDVTSFQNNTLRNYELGVFDIKASVASDKEIAVYMNPDLGLWNRVKEKLVAQNSKRKIITEKVYHFQSELQNATKNTYIKGHWQSEKYFFNYGEIIKDDFLLKRKFSEENQVIADKIRAKTNSVSLHVRRTDYVNDQLMYPLGFDYYQKAVKLMSDKLQNPYFFIFSDDPETVKKEMSFECDYEFVQVNQTPESAHNDLILMSLCQHNIIANSSFSWWGAWLNQNDDKTVYAPQQWFRDGAIWYDGTTPNAQDIIPTAWQII